MRAVTMHPGLVLGGLGGLLVALFLLAGSVGIASVGLSQVLKGLGSMVLPGLKLPSAAAAVVFDLRLPRLLLALVAGCGLALSGTAVQGVLMNPLVSPYVLGVSSGAAFGAALAIVSGVDLAGAGRYLVVANALLLACLAMLVAYGIARIRKATPETLILAGIAVGYIFSALVAVLQYVSSHQQLRDIFFWLMGSLWDARPQTALIIAPVVAAGLLILMRLAWDLNALASGEEVAASLGVRVGRVRLTALAVASLLTATVVAFTGVIGFVCLVSPHIARMLVGGDHRYLIPASGLVGALLLLGADTAARGIVWPLEVPVGIMTALIGGPFFIYLLLKRRKDWWS